MALKTCEMRSKLHEIAISFQQITKIPQRGGFAFRPPACGTLKLHSLLTRLFHLNIFWEENTLTCVQIPRH